MKSPPIYSPAIVLTNLVATIRWRPWRTPLIWDKGSTGHAPARTQGWRRSHELILFASKGGKGFSTVTSDVIRVPNVRDKGHAAEKPTELYVQLLKRSCLPRNRVLDPCCGSGTIFQAARETYTTATGIECDEKAYGLALARLAA